MNIPKDRWHTCEVCGTDIKTLATKYGGKNVYYTKVFVAHLHNDHNSTIEQYFLDIGLSGHKCACGV